jgi:pyruvate kinase
MINLQTKKLKQQLLKEYNEMIIIRYILEFGKKYNELYASLENTKDKRIVQSLCEDVMKIYEEINIDNVMTIISSLNLSFNLSKTNLEQEILHTLSSVNCINLLNMRCKILNMVFCNNKGYYNAENIRENETTEIRKIKKVIQKFIKNDCDNYYTTIQLIKEGHLVTN